MHMSQHVHLPHQEAFASRTRACEAHARGACAGPATLAFSARRARAVRRGGGGGGGGGEVSGRLLHRLCLCWGWLGPSGRVSSRPRLGEPGGAEPALEGLLVALQRGGVEGPQEVGRRRILW